MIFSAFILAISTSIDSFGIGLTYGLKKTYIQFISKLILFGVSFIVAFSSVFIGKLINNFFDPTLTTIISSTILICIGTVLIYKTISQKDQNNNTYYDFNNSKTIEPTESLFLALALSLDSFGIGVGYGLLNWNTFLFPILVVMFQYLFLSLGIYLGNNLTNIKIIPNYLWNLISGILILVIGIIKLII